MKGIIVVNAYSKIKGIQYQAERMKGEFALLDCETEIVPADEICHAIRGGKAYFGRQADFVLFLDKDDYLARTIEKCGIRLFNSARAIALCDDKMLTYLALSDSGIPMPETIPSLLRYTEEGDSERYLKRVEQTLGYPLIAKQSFGSLGKGVVLVRDGEKLREIEEKWKFQQHLYQQYISAHAGEDIRVIVIGKKAVAAMRRVNEGDYRSNIELGGRGENCEPDEEFLCTAEKAAEILGLDYCGVDLLIDENNRPVLCEVNSNAFFTGIEACTKTNVAQKYAAYILKILSY